MKRKKRAAARARSKPAPSGLRATKLKLGWLPAGFVATDERTGAELEVAPEYGPNVVKGAWTYRVRVPRYDDKSLVEAEQYDGVVGSVAEAMGEAEKILRDHLERYPLLPRRGCSKCGQPFPRRR